MNEDCRAQQHQTERGWGKYTIITPVATDNDDTIKYIDGLWSFIASHLSVVVINRLLPS